MPSSLSSRNLAIRCASSGPWQAKQLSEKIGRISRLKSIVFEPASGAAKVIAGLALHSPARQININKNRPANFGVRNKKDACKGWDGTWRPVFICILSDLNPSKWQEPCR